MKSDCSDFAEQSAAQESPFSAGRNFPEERATVLSCTAVSQSMLVPGFERPKVLLCDGATGLRGEEGFSLWARQVRGEADLLDEDRLAVCPQLNSDEGDGLFSTVVGTVLSVSDVVCLEDRGEYHPYRMFCLLSVDHREVAGMAPTWCTGRIHVGQTVIASFSHKREEPFVAASIIAPLNPALYHLLLCDAPYVSVSSELWTALLASAVACPNRPRPPPPALSLDSFSSFPLVSGIQSLRSRVSESFDVFAMIATLLFSEIPRMFLSKALLCLLLFSTEPVHALLVRSSCAISAKMIDTFAAIPRIVCPFPVGSSPKGGTAARLCVPGASGVVLADGMEDLLRTSPNFADMLFELSCVAPSVRSRDAWQDEEPSTHGCAAVLSQSSVACIAAHSVVGVLNIESSFVNGASLLSQCSRVRVPADRLHTAVHSFPLVGVLDAADDLVGDADAAYADWYCGALDAVAFPSGGSTVAVDKSALWLSSRFAVAEELLANAPGAAQLFSVELIVHHVHQACAAVAVVSVAEDAMRLLAQISTQAAARDAAGVSADEWNRILTTLSKARARIVLESTVKLVHVIDVLEVLKWAAVEKGSAPKRGGRGGGGKAGAKGRSVKAKTVLLLESLRTRRAPGATIFSKSEVAAAGSFVELGEADIDPCIEYLRKCGVVIYSKDGYQVLHWST